MYAHFINTERAMTDSADDKLVIFFLLFLENRIPHFMQNLFCRKVIKIFQNCVC